MRFPLRTVCLFVCCTMSTTRHCGLNWRTSFRSHLPGRIAQNPIPNWHLQKVSCGYRTKKKKFNFFSNVTNSPFKISLVWKTTVIYGETHVSMVQMAKILFFHPIWCTLWPVMTNLVLEMWLTTNYLVSCVDMWIWLWNNHLCTRKVIGFTQLIKSYDLVWIFLGESYQSHPILAPWKVSCEPKTPANFWIFLPRVWTVLFKHIWWENQSYLYVNNMAQIVKICVFWTQKGAVFNTLRPTWCLKRD